LFLFLFILFSVTYLTYHFKKIPSEIQRNTKKENLINNKKNKKFKKQ